MPHYKFHYNLNPLPRTWHWLLKGILACSILGGIYGAGVGAAISTRAGAADVIGIAAGIMAVLWGIPGAKFGFFVGILNRMRFARLFLGMLAATGGAIFGGFLGMIVVMPLGAILGATGGWLISQTIVQRGLFKRFVGGVVGVVQGACLGVVALALQRNQADALVGIAWGVGIGAVVSPLPLILFVKMMDSLARRQHPKSTIINVKVEDVPKDEIEGPPKGES